LRIKGSLMPRAYPASSLCQLTFWMVFSQLQISEGAILFVQEPRKRFEA
jgi:hypothetical protein